MFRAMTIDSRGQVAIREGVQGVAVPEIDGIVWIDLTEQDAESLEILKDISSFIR